MEVPTVSIKIKGLDAIQALSGKGQLLGTLKVPAGAAAAKGPASLKFTELEAKRVIVTKKGLVLQEIEGHAVLEGSNGFAATKSAVTTKGALGTKGGVVVKSAAAKSAIVPGAALSAKGLGWSLGLGGLGPWLALGALGLAATGVYFYLRAQRMETEADDGGDFESAMQPSE